MATTEIELTEIDKLTIRACTFALECLLEALDINDLSATFSDGLAIADSFHEQIGAMDECFELAVREAFRMASEAFPPLGGATDPLDLTAVESLMADLQAQATNPLAFLEAAGIEIVFDADGVPEKIIVTT